MHTQYYVGCDLGGTNIKAGLVDLNTGQVIASKDTKTLSYLGHRSGHQPHREPDYGDGG